MLRAASHQGNTGIGRFTQFPPPRPHGQQVCCGPIARRLISACPLCVGESRQIAVRAPPVAERTGSGQAILRVVPDRPSIRPMDTLPMARAITTSQKAFALTMLVTLGVAFLPVRWLRWSNDVAGIVNAPLAPFSQLGVLLASWLRPARGPVIDLPESAARIIEERERYESLYHAEQLRVQALEEQLAQLQQVPLENLRVPVRLVLADVIGRSPGAASGVIELKRGSRDGVSPGNVAVYAGVHLVGQVRDVDRLRSLMVPVTSPAIGLVGGAVRPKDRPEAPMRGSQRIHLEAGGDGTLVAHVDREMDVHSGDEIVLVDDGWPAAAQAMVLGVVDAIVPVDETPLRKRVIVRPHYQADELAHVTLKIEVAQAVPAAGTPATPSQDDRRGTPDDESAGQSGGGS
jgi:cell shape-determining protein MreC